MPLQVLQRLTWNGTPVEMDHMFRLYKQRGDREHEVICRLMSHQFGWELRPDVNGALQQSQVCRSQDQALDASDAWKAAMLEKGWS